MIKARALGSKVYLYFMKKGRQVRHRIPRNSCCSVYVRVSVRICPDHNLYNNAWISKQFGTVVALEEEKCQLKPFFLDRLKVNVTGVNKGQNSHVLSLSGA